MDIDSAYLTDVFNRPERLQLMRNARKILRRVDFDTIVVRGVSGIVFGSILAHKMRKGLTVIRKPGEGTHSHLIVEGSIPGPNDRWIILDDFVCTGATLIRIIEDLGYRPGWAGVYLFKCNTGFVPYPFEDRWASYGYKELRDMINEYAARNGD